MNTVARQTLSIMMVIGLVVGGLPLFFAATDNAEAAVGVWEKRDKALSITDSHGYLTVDVSTFEDEGNKPIQGYTLLLKWDACRKDLNPLSGFWRTLRDPQTATITTDAKGEAEYTFSIPNMCWTENLWVYGSSEGWQNIEYFLGNIASTRVRLDIQTQASMATEHAMQRADTLGIIQDWYRMVDTQYEYTGPDMSYFSVQSSKTFAGSTAINVKYYLDGWSSNKNLKPDTGTASSGSIVDFKSQPNFHYDDWPSQVSQGTYYMHIEDIYTNIIWLSCATPEMGYGNYKVNVYAVCRDTGENITVVTNHPSSGIVLYDIPWGNYDFIIEAVVSSTSKPIVEIQFGYDFEFVLTGLTEADKTITLDVFSDSSSSVTIDLSGRWGEWQTSGYSSTLTDQDLVPVAAHINGVYPLVISNPRWDRTPIADAMNGLKFDVYNLRSGQTTETINLALTTDNGTQTWATTVGSKIYPAWTNASQFTTVHLTDVFMPAEPRKEYTLTISSGGAITEIPVVFYPSEMDPDVVYEPKKDLDEIIKDYGTVNAAALKAYHDWAASIQPRIEAIKSDVQNYTKLFEDRAAVDHLALSDAAATRGLELITKLKEICRGDGSDTSIGELTSHAQGIWSSYQAALLYRETAIAYEAGQDAFGNRTALDAWYQDLVSKRITTGLTDQKQGDDPNSVAVWVGVAAALVVGGLVMYLCWKYIVPPLKSMLPKGRTKRMRTIRTITPVAVTVVLAILIALVAFLATWNIALSIEAALR